MRRLLHYQLTQQETRALCKSHGNFDPMMICRTGDGHAKGTRNLGAVNCLACRRALKESHLTTYHGPDMDEVEEEGELVEEGEE